MKPRLSGIVPIMSTPFDSSGRLDMDSYRHQIDYLISAGVQGVTALGVASETYALTDDERRIVARTAVEHVAGRVPVVVGVGSHSGQAARTLAVETTEIGADVLMIMPPSFVKPSSSQIYEFFSIIADGRTAPIMIQDNPGWTGVTIDAEVMSRMCDLDLVQYVKVETPNPPVKMEQVRRYCKDTLTILGGLAGNWFPEELVRGSQGCMPAAIMPQVYVAVWSLWQQGDKSRAKEIYHRYHPLIRLTNTPGWGPAMVKQLLFRQGIIRHPFVRNPVSPLGPQAVADLEELVEELAIPGMVL
jgi:2-keto-3-deoxy-L-arabinonate dehydratase